MTDKITTVLDNAERLNPQLNSFLSIEREHAETRAYERGSAASRFGHRGERQYLHKRIADYMRFANSSQLPGPLRCDRDKTIERRRGDRGRQDEHGRVCDGLIE